METLKTVSIDARRDYSDMIKRFATYKFKDEQGHPLENCVDFTNLVKEWSVNKYIVRTVTEVCSNQ